MINDIKDIRTIRMRLGMTQKELAIRAGVSQSLIAKVEAGTIDPAYSNARKIFQALSAHSDKEEVKVAAIMQRHIIKLSPDQELTTAISHMKKFGISQIPVIEGQALVGFVSDSILLEHVTKDKHMKVGDIMQDPPPVVSKNASLKVVTGLLRFYPFVMVAEKGTLNGIVTKADILNSL